MNPEIISISAQEEEELWRLVYEKRDIEVRGYLIDYYLKFANKLAGKYFANRPDNTVEYSDYYQYAVVGLIESVDRYIPGGKSSFSTYAAHRIKGAILNGVEKASENREQIAYRTRVRKERISSLTNNEVDSGQDLFLQMVELTIDIAMGYLLEDSGLTNDSDDGSNDTTLTHYGIAEVKLQMDRIINTLPDRERIIITYHYYHQMSFESIAKVLSISKGRVSQIHKDLLHYIRQKIFEDSKFDNFY